MTLDQVLDAVARRRHGLVAAAATRPCRRRGRPRRAPGRASWRKNRPRCGRAAHRRLATILSLYSRESVSSTFERSSFLTWISMCRGGVAGGHGRPGARGRLASIDRRWFTVSSLQLRPGRPPFCWASWPALGPGGGSAGGRGARRRRRGLGGGGAVWAWPGARPAAAPGSPAHHGDRRPGPQARLPGRTGSAGTRIHSGQHGVAPIQSIRSRQVIPARCNFVLVPWISTISIPATASPPR